MSDRPRLLRLPEACHTVEEALGAASQAGLSNVIVISEEKDGALVFLSSEMTAAEANWLIDRAKALIVTPGAFSRDDG